MTTLEIATLAIAVIGAVLGIYNTFFKEREKLEVLIHLSKGRTEWLISGEGEGLFAQVEIVNHSAFAISVRAVDLEIEGTRVLSGVWNYGGDLPIKIEPRDTKTIEFPQNLLVIEEPHYEITAKVKTVTGKAFSATLHK